MHFEDTLLSLQFRRSLLVLRQNGQLTDISLKVDGKDLPCHRVVLAAASPYFRAMFTSGFEESCSPTVEIKTTDYVTLQHVVDYVYSAEIDITQDNVQNILQISSEYQFESLQQVCEKYMLQQVDCDNCIGLLKFANLFNLEVLRNGARNAMLMNFQAVASSVEFTEMAEDELVEYISDQELAVANEDAVFEAVTSWVNFNLPERREAFERVLAHVRLPYCTGAYLCQVVERHPLMTSRYQKYVHEARVFQSLPEGQHEMVTPKTIARNSFGVKRRLVIFTEATDQEGQDEGCWEGCCYYEEEADCWLPLAKLPDRDISCSSICLTRIGFVLSGGLDRAMDNIAVEESWLYSAVDRKWIALDDLDVARFDHRAVTLCDQVYVVGGIDEDDRTLNSVECLDTKTWKWSEVAPMVKALTLPMVVSFGHNIYVFGGKYMGADSKTHASTSTQVYDRVWGKWITKADMPKTCRGGAAVTLNERVFVFGGRRGTCMSYSPALDTWTVLKKSGHSLAQAPAVVWNGKILIGGGVSDGGDGAEDGLVFEEYDPATNSWSLPTISPPNVLFCNYMLNVDISAFRI